MKASIHISTGLIKVIAYTKVGLRITVKDFLTYPLPEESVLNGVILDGTQIIEGLRLLKSSQPSLFKEASLVIDGSFVYTKKITVPGKLNKLMYDEVIRDEFAEISSDSENLICDHFLLNSNQDGSKEILACAVENAHAQAYLAIFQAAGIKLSSVHLGVLTVLQFVASNSELKSVPFVLNVVDDVVLLSMIFQNGVNVFQSRTRLYGDERATLVQNTLDGLSGILQFNKSEKYTDLTNCFYLGLSDADMSLVAMNVSYPEISFSLLNIYRDAKGAEMLPPNAHFAFLNALVPDSQADLLNNIRMLEKAKARRKPKNRWIPIIAGTAALLALVIAGLWFLVNGVERDVREIKNHLNSPGVIAQRDEASSLSMDTARINNLYNAVADQRDETAARPQVSNRLLSTIVRTGGTAVTINGMNFDSDNRVLSVSASSATEYDASSYVEALKRDSLIEDVSYTGYRTGSDGEFIFSIDVKAEGWSEEEDAS